MSPLLSFSLCITCCLPCLTSSMSPSASLSQFSLLLSPSLCLPPHIFSLSLYLFYPNIPPLYVFTTLYLPLSVFFFNSPSICHILSFPSISLRPLFLVFSLSSLVSSSLSLSFRLSKYINLKHFKYTVRVSRNRDTTCM
jgi:hypothetical protein